MADPDRSLVRRPPSLRLVAPHDVGELMAVAANDNPFLAREEIVARDVVSERIGLLVAARAATTTLLYLWTHPVDDISEWMAHAAQWFERHSSWRKAHDLTPSAESVRVVLAGPAIGPSVRSALRLVSSPVTLARYVYGESSGNAVLGWESDVETTGEALQSIASPIPRSLPQGEVSDPAELTPQELEFFLRG